MEFVALDLALRLRQAGYTASYEPGSQLSSATSLIGWPAADTLGAEFSRGIHCERIFWRHLPEAGRVGTIVCHPLTICREVLCRPGLPGKLMHLGGRFLALLDFTRLAPEHSVAPAQIKRPEAKAPAGVNRLAGMKGAKLAGSLERQSAGDRRTA